MFFVPQPRFVYVWCCARYQGKPSRAFYRHAAMAGLGGRKQALNDVGLGPSFSASLGQVSHPFDTGWGGWFSEQGGGGFEQGVRGLVVWGGSNNK